jgi:predicted ABC-class ATPase
MQSKGIIATKNKKIEIETAFARLYLDFKSARLERTFNRLNLSVKEKARLAVRLEDAHKSVTLPAYVLRRTPSVSPHKQQELYQRLIEMIDTNQASLQSLIPLHPGESHSFESYASVLKLCHEVILRIDTSRNLHRFHAILARQWMLGWSVP